VKPAYNGKARVQIVFFTGSFFLTPVIEVWILGTPDTLGVVKDFR
jgi:hypothetical protein